MSRIDLEVREQYTATSDGWSLHLRRTRLPGCFDPTTKPLLIVPGYGMNTFIFSFHPRNTSMERCLAEAGFEVWSVNLRGQGPSRRDDKNAPEPSLDRYATIDVPTAVNHVLDATATESRTLSLIGCSLGGTIALGYLALQKPKTVTEFVAMGAPLRWNDVHPLLKIAFASPTIAGKLRLSGTRELVKGAMPLLRRIPSLLSLYMNPSTIDMDRMDEMAQTVEDPHPAINREIAEWIAARDLVIRGVNLTKAAEQMAIPLLNVIARQDGIVPESTARSLDEAWGGGDIEVLAVGDKHRAFAHANLFVANDAPLLVFEPLIQWLRRQQRRLRPSGEGAAHDSALASERQERHGKGG
ncbi:MAG: alpha/beta fold hydrolase [Polyangiaceae bacterium]